MNQQLALTLAMAGLTAGSVMAQTTTIEGAPMQPTPAPALEVIADRLDGLYQKGEPISFTIKAAHLPADTPFDYGVVLDAATTLKTGKARSGETVAITVEQPGFVIITVKGKALAAFAAAAIAPLEIRATPRPADFKDYWKGKLASLAAIPPNLKLKPFPQPTDADYKDWAGKWPVFGDYTVRFKDIDVYEVEADSLGEPVRGYLAMPHGAAPASLPAVLFAHGAGIGDADLLKPCAAARLGFLAMDINAHGLLLRQTPAYYKQVADDAMKKHGGYFKKGRLDKDTLYLTEMYLRHYRALDVLRSRPEWDGRNLAVHGASQGGGLALACAGLDPKVTAICCGVPAFCDNNTAQLPEYWFLKPDDDEATKARVKESIAYGSVCHFGPETRAAAYFTVAFLDSSCKPATVYAAFNAYAGPKRIFNGPVAGHGDIPRSIHYDDFARFLLEQAASKR